VNRLVLPLIGVGLTVSITGAAQADPTCTTEPREKWMSEEAFKEKAVDEQRISEIRKFEVTDTNCYEIYGFRDGEQIEIYFDPVTGAVVQEGD
jgi:hypothetical protein